MIGQYLSDGYITSREIINVIERISYDSESPLAYLLKSLKISRKKEDLKLKSLLIEKLKWLFPNSRKSNRWVLGIVAVYLFYI